MIVFIITNLLLAAVVISQSSIQTFLTEPYVLVIAFLVMIVCMVLGYLKKLTTTSWHDGFATASLLVWFAWWKSQFIEEAPMFFLYPLYYALITSFVTLSLINRAGSFDLESVNNLRYMDKMLRFDMRTSVAFVLAALVITRHYALYPMAMTFFVLRHSIASCLEVIDRS